MNERILQINFRFNVSRTEYEQAANALAGEFAELDGLRWKIWLMNEKEREAGGIYVFENEKSLGAFLAGPLAAKVTNHPAISNMTVKQWENMPDVTTITRGPIKP
ncbi:MAG: YdhR family protein [Candidatus Zixiibacteriota bacterium]|nr:MAG: YdhR family protein [candidate division Zixibacteria bacterium]